MQQLNLKPTHKIVRDYYASMAQYDAHNIRHEGAVSSPFATLLSACARQVNATLVPQYQMHTPQGNRIVIDGVILDEYRLRVASWEAKDMDDNLKRAVQEKRDAGYPFDNILFQTPQRGILYQNGLKVFDRDITDPTRLIETLQHLFTAPQAALKNWYTAADEFKERVPELGREAAELIVQEQKTNPQFVSTFTNFFHQCCEAINPNLSVEAVEEMLIQHLLTERIFRTVFNNPDFTQRNIIAREIEKVITPLIQQAFSRDEFLKPLDPFYLAIEKAAMLCRDFSQKQDFLNTVYEKFFQGFSVKVADTHGIVYTPQPIVSFMVNSVEHLLKMEFDRSLSDRGVHIIDPFVGTGNFIVRLMRDIRGTALEHKYRYELHCNEVLLMPYYIASLNIEHEYFQRTGTYLPFEGITLADTFELLEQQPGAQVELFTRENTERVEKQKTTDMFVVIGNPPYNAGQVNENDNNKNRKYPAMGNRVRRTYGDDSKAQNKNALYDPYIKAIRWGLDRIKDEGVVAFVTNHSFIDGIAFDGMRKHLSQDCDAIYLLDLGGNVRNARKGLKVSDANVFGIQVGVSINLFVKRKRATSEKTRIFYYRTDDEFNKEQKFEFLNERQHAGAIEWQQLQPDPRYTWLTEGLHPEFDTFIPMGTKEAKGAKGVASDVIFKTYSRGVVTCRDAWAYNFNRNALTENIGQMIETYNAEVARWKQRTNQMANLDDFVLADNRKISWSESLKLKLKRGKITDFSTEKIRASLYRPFTKSNLYFDRMMTDRVYVFPSIFPMPDTEKENKAICVSGIGNNKPSQTLMVDVIPCVDMLEKTQCFPFYTYNEDSTNRRENITDWALTQFRTHYSDASISKWDIFHYTYGLLHHPDYREKYQVNLHRDLPHIPIAKDFWGFANAGEQLADLHVNYESVPKYDELRYIESPDMPIDWLVEKMKLSKDKTQLVYNDFLTIAGIPPEAFDYQLGTRSALESVIDQYHVKVDKRSGIVNDPNRADAQRYIVDLIARVIQVSLKTAEIVADLPELPKVFVSWKKENNLE